MLSNLHSKWIMNLQTHRATLHMNIVDLAGISDDDLKSVPNLGTRFI